MANICFSGVFGTACDKIKPFLAKNWSFSQKMQAIFSNNSPTPPLIFFWLRTWCLPIFEHNDFKIQAQTRIMSLINRSQNSWLFINSTQESLLATVFSYERRALQQRHGQGESSSSKTNTIYRLWKPEHFSYLQNIGLISFCNLIFVIAFFHFLFSVCFGFQEWDFLIKW